MSNRAFKKLHGEKLEKGNLPDGEESEEEQPITKKTNLFDLLGDDDSELPPDEDEAEENPAPIKLNTSSGKKKRRQKKGKNKNQPVEAQAVEENIDDIIKQFGDVKSNLGKQEITEAPAKKSIFSLDVKNLDADTEMERIFGKKTMKEVLKESKNHRRVMHMKTFLVKPKEHWPKPTTGIGMDFIETKDGISYFKITFNASYKATQEEFYRCVQSGNPSSFQYLLSKCPYHVDSLLQLSEICKKTGEFEMAMDLIERAVFIFEHSWHHLFNPISGLCRLDYAVEENRTFFLTLFRYIQMLGRGGNARTALEYCKLLLSLDPSDPLFVQFIIDHYCLRSQEFAYLLQVYNCPELADKHLSSVPNFCYSAALAKFQLERSDKEKNSTDKKASEYLQYALMMFPSALAPLVKKAGLSMMEPDAKGAAKELTLHPFFSAVGPPAVQHLITLFVERNYTLWKEAEVAQWLKENASIVAKKADARDPMIETCAVVLKEEYSESQKNTYHHLLLSEYTDHIEALPPDIIEAIRMGQAGPQIYESFQEVRTPTIHARTSNPLALFLQTLAPWNREIPNAPPIEGAENNVNFLQDLLAFLTAQRDEEQEPHED
eukprot:TRINITY_DN2075_c0_g1_i1.p1 TRINITY_DN2075_c0_g1~~TRINITY_DN2075_c0_g1_i1.p1  ORF type:complete len:604 (+),score=194.27 TRINITY_DN2075_c0_g1_i1:1340-3151(+)